MNTMSSGRMWLPAVAVVAFVLAGCADQTAGQASAGDPTSEGSGSSESSAPPSEPNSGGDKLAEFDYCSLLAEGDLADLGLEAGKPADADVTDRPNCGWSTKEAADGYGITVVYIDNMGIDEIQNADAKPVPTTVGEQEAVKFQSLAGGNSAIAWQVTDSSRVEVVATTSLGVEKQDALAEQYAKLFEQRLPKGNG